MLDARLKSYFEPEGAHADPLAIAPPALGSSHSPYARFVRLHALATPSRLLLLLALVPHLRPQLLDVLWARNEAIGRGFTEFGGAHGVHHGGFLPTGETAAFLLAGDQLAARLGVMRLLEEDPLLARHDVVRLAPVATNEPPLSGALTITRESLALFTTGAATRPELDKDFPARPIHTELSWADLVLPSDTLEQIEEIKKWVVHGGQLLREWGMHRRLRPGFTSLFHGPPGTGKTLSACLLGKHVGCEVYRVDLSMVVSKYIGETEKNLARVFDLAEGQRWILFFDEADALFGKRTRVADAHDRYANQEISYLLQRIEDFDGVVILATNFKTNMDDAFLRRFQSVVGFAMPRSHERRRLWSEAFSPRAQLDARIDLDRVAERYDLSGGTIMNVVRYASLMAVSRGGTTVLLEDLEEGVRRELLKEGKSL